MSIGAIWAEIWDETIWDTTIWSQEAATPEPEVKAITRHSGIVIKTVHDPIRIQHR